MMRWAGMVSVRACCVGVWLLAVDSPLLAQSTPSIENVFPAGVQRGTEVEVQIATNYLPGNERVILAGEGIHLKRQVSQGRYLLAVDADAKPGLREVRVATVQGASSPFPFVVGDLTEIVCDAPSERTDLKVPVTVNGRFKSPGRIDEYSLDLKVGTQIVCAVTTKAIKSPVTPKMQLLDPQGNIVAKSDDERSADSLLAYRAVTSGRFVLQVFDFLLSGGPDYIYRLTVTDGMWLEYAYPSGLQRNVDGELSLYGFNLPSDGGRVLKHRVTPQTSEIFELTLPGAANQLLLPVDREPNFFESEPNNTAEAANVFMSPAALNGRIDVANDIDNFAFTATKGQKLLIEVASESLGFPTDLVLSVSNADGKVIVEADDNKTSRDPLLRFAAPAAGRYVLTLRNRYPVGGEDFVYRVRCAEAQPRLAARVNTASMTLTSGKKANLSVVVERLDGFVDELEVTAIDVPEGVTVTPQPVPAKTPATIQVPIEVNEKTPPIGQLVRVVVRKTKSDVAWELPATVAESAKETSGSPYLWLAICPEIPFTLKTTTTILDAPRLSGFPFPVTVQRAEGFTGPIRLVGVEPDRRGTVKALDGIIPADENSGSIVLVLQNKVTEGTTHRCRVMGVADVSGIDGKKYSVFHIAAGQMSIGCQPSLLTLTSEPSLLTWRPNRTERIAIQLMRRTSMEPIQLRLEPPASVTGVECEPVTVSPNENRAELVVRFAADTVVAPRATFTIKAESSRDGLPVYGFASLRVEAE